MIDAVISFSNLFTALNTPGWESTKCEKLQ
jgi:hypothetical protein